jgi:glutamyl-Q tRNA(Asp) synthetase
MYRGRFAPSPTGPLHFGSLVAAVASYLEARTHNGQWLVRMEDLDRPREMPGAAHAILHALEAFGFIWDDDVWYQSRRDSAYAQALQRLSDSGLIYPCGCTRKEIVDSAVHGIDGHVYPGICRHGLAPGKSARAWRLKTEDRIIAFEDAIQGPVGQNLARDIGDFVLKRADSLYAYQLAVVVDDAEQGITHVVRGADLLDSTPRQIYLQQLLNFATPAYAHVPVVANADGEKLSKQTLAQALDVKNPVPQLWQALRFLGQRPAPALQQVTLATLWKHAEASWQLASIPRLRQLPETVSEQN